MANNMITKAEKGENALGIFLGDTDSTVAEIAAIAGFDFFRVDSEHALVDPSKFASTIRIADAYDIPVLVRVSTLEEMTKLVDFGATGFLVSDVDTPEKAKAAVDVCKYAPVGKRSLARSNRCCKYGDTPMDEYLKFAEKNIKLGVQIESQEGLDNLDAILEVPGVDIVAFGRLDISQNLGIAGQTTHPMVVEAENYVIKKALEHGKYPLITCSNEKQFDELTGKGVKLLTIAFDTQFILKSFKNQIARFRK